MTLRLFVLASLLGGCLVVPATKTTTRPAGTAYGTSSLSESSALELATRTDKGAIAVTARRRGMCVRPVYRVTEVTSEKHAKLGGSDDPRAAAFGALFAVVTIPVSAVVTGFVLAADHATTEEKRQLVAREHFPCAVPANDVSLDVGLPTGATLHARTDETGQARVAVPASEPYQGVVQISAPGVVPHSATYSLPRPPYVAARDAVLSCAATHAVSGHIDLALTINDTGFVTRLWLSAGDSTFNACVAQQLAGVKFPAAAYDRTIRLPLVADAT